MYVCMQQVVGNTSLLRPPALAPAGTYTHPESSANRFSVALLEEEIADLKKSLRRAESRLVRTHIYIHYINTYIHTLRRTIRQIYKESLILASHIIIRLLTYNIDILHTYIQYLYSTYLHAYVCTYVVLYVHCLP